MPSSEWNYKARLVRNDQAAHQTWTEEPWLECLGKPTRITTHGISQVQPLIRGKKPMKHNRTGCDNQQ